MWYFAWILGLGLALLLSVLNTLYCDAKAPNDEPDR
ncbi:cytochrome bd-I oxidase subunit CydX [Pseudomonas panipatensis]|uniref:Cyd operon protein YbgT n=1 Tax=Pseudomonas panipatensis TaxID=428992 RepID=A0A1G8MMS3_9PSED|nr:cytochrome bd-I oxidase subunit CydX [Pseudomonas panipatensis]SDI69204.1 cyd operon protein YbgT [Pseudomonas panipatensis]SMP77548.1 cyd operon protein YbgT [Pseudomonas panipatensis]